VGAGVRDGDDVVPRHLECCVEVLDLGLGQPVEGRDEENGRGTTSGQVKVNEVGSRMNASRVWPPRMPKAENIACECGSLAAVMMYDEHRAPRPVPSCFVVVFVPLEFNEMRVHFRQMRVCVHAAIPSG